MRVNDTRVGEEEPYFSMAYSPDTCEKTHCAICWQPFEKDSSIAMHEEKGIKHPFHSSCALEAFSKSFYCPACSTPVNPFDLLPLKTKMKWYFHVLTTSKIIKVATIVLLSSAASFLLGSKFFFNEEAKAFFQYLGGMIVSSGTGLSVAFSLMKKIYTEKTLSTLSNGALSSVLGIGTAALLGKVTMNGAVSSAIGTFATGSSILGMLALASV